MGFSRVKLAETQYTDDKITLYDVISEEILGAKDGATPLALHLPWVAPDDTLRSMKELVKTKGITVRRRIPFQSMWIALSIGAACGGAFLCEAPITRDMK